jgi:hypothetical protein
MKNDIYHMGIVLGITLLLVGIDVIPHTISKCTQNNSTITNMVDGRTDDKTTPRNLVSNGIKNWTFLAYLDGDMSDIEGPMLYYIDQMESIGSTADVNIIVQADDCGFWNNQTRRYYIIHDENPDVIASPLADNDTSEKDMGDPQTLIDFVCWAVDRYPADKYCLSMFDHGTGWIGTCGDITNNGSCLDMAELKTTMSEIKTHLGKKLDILLMNACEMAMLEVFSQIQQDVTISIAAEVPIGSQDISYKRILENVTEQPWFSPMEFSQKIIDASSNKFFGVYLVKIGDIQIQVNELAQALLKNMPSKTILRNVYTNSYTRIPWQPATFAHDIYSFSQSLLQMVDDSTIKEKAAILMDLINTSVIRQGSDRFDYSDTDLHGISIYFPSANASYNGKYEEVDFAQETVWVDFLRAFFSEHITFVFLIGVVKDVKHNSESIDFTPLFVLGVPSIYGVSIITPIDFLGDSFCISNDFTIGFVGRHFIIGSFNPIDISVPLYA